MKSLALVIALLFCASAGYGQSKAVSRKTTASRKPAATAVKKEAPLTPVEWIEIDQLCGQFHRNPVREYNGAPLKAKSEEILDGSKVEVYRVADQTRRCCDEKTQQESVIVGQLGSFVVEQHKAGYYWLRVHPSMDSAAYDVPLHVSKAYDERACKAPRSVRLVYFDAKPPKAEVVNF